MLSTRHRLECAFLAAVACLLLAACGSARRAASTATANSGPLKAFELLPAGSPEAQDAPIWTQYGAKPLDTTLTINAVSVYDAGTQPLVLLGIRQKRPLRGLTFTSEQVTVTSGFESYSEQVEKGAPAAAFGLHANFSPLRGFLVDPDPHSTPGAGSPSLVLTARATRPGIFRIGDWLVTYQVGSRRYTVDLVDDGEFCVGAHGCPQLG
jgi:hypothetical protein